MLVTMAEWAVVSSVPHLQLPCHWTMCTGDYPGHMTGFGEGWLGDANVGLDVAVAQDRNAVMAVHPRGLYARH